MTVRPGRRRHHPRQHPLMFQLRLRAVSGENGVHLSLRSSSASRRNFCPRLDLMAVGAYVAFFLVNTAFVALGFPDATATFGPLSFGLPMLSFGLPMALALPVAMLVTAGVAVSR